MQDAPQPDEPRPEPSDGRFPIVGVGASAGGLDAFTQFFSHLQPRTGMAFILVQHLDPHHESRLPEILGKSTWMKVQETRPGQRVEPNNVYIIPPNATITLSAGVLHVSPREGKTPHLPVDHLFRSLSRELGGRAIGMVLSGTGSDGTQGICEIKAVGGITFSQDPPDRRQMIGG